MDMTNEMAENRRGKPYGELAHTSLNAFYSISEIRQWREQQHCEGKASGLQDFYNAHGLCWVCKATGVTVNPIDWDRTTGLFAYCDICHGTGKVGNPAPPL
jgi:hypothetical protein